MSWPQLRYGVETFRDVDPKKNPANILDRDSLVGMDREILQIVKMRKAAYLGPILRDSSRREI